MFPVKHHKETTNLYQGMLLKCRIHKKCKMLTAHSTVKEMKEQEFPLLPVNYFWAGILNSFISALPAGGIMTN